MKKAMNWKWLSVVLLVLIGASLVPGGQGLAQIRPQTALTLPPVKVPLSIKYAPINSRDALKGLAVPAAFAAAYTRSYGSTSVVSADVRTGAATASLTFVEPGQYAYAGFWGSAIQNSGYTSIPEVGAIATVTLTQVVGVGGYLDLEVFENETQIHNRQVQFNAPGTYSAIMPPSITMKPGSRYCLKAYFWQSKGSNPDNKITAISGQFTAIKFTM